MSAERLLPVPDETSAGYWSAAADHVLTVARCSVCHAATMPPDLVCPTCHTTEPDFQFVPVAPRGTMCSWTITRQALLPGFEVPFLLVDVQLDDAPEVRMIGRLLDGVDAKIALGAAIDVVFEDLTDDISVPAFSLASNP